MNDPVVPRSETGSPRTRGKWLLLAGLAALAAFMYGSIMVKIVWFGF